MARMLPKAVAEQTPSNAERVMFRRIRDQLGDDWVAIHSLGMTTHARKPWAEIDFVLIGPPGVFCLEVKGGGIGRRDGKWTTTNSFGDTFELKESPFAQVGSASAALYKFLLSHVPPIKKGMTGYLVATPDCRFQVSGPDIENEIVYDDRDAAADFSQYMNRVVAYWTEQTRARWSRTAQVLSTSDLESVRKALLKDFDLRPSLRSTLSALHEDVIRYTAEQALVMKALAANPRVMVRGGAGTGKTVIAAEEATRLAADGQSVLLTCFNRRLARHLDSLGLDRRRVKVASFHQLMWELIEKGSLRAQIPDADQDYIHRVVYPELALRALVERIDVMSFDAIVIDEGQDLLIGDYVDVMDLLLKGGIQEGNWRVFLDPNQNLFGGIDVEGLRRLRDARPAEFDLKINCRNAKQIAVTSSVLSGAPLAEALRVDGGITEMIRVADPAEERRKVSKIVGMLLHRGVDHNHIVILSPRRLENSCLRDGLIGGVGVLTAEDSDGLPSDGGIHYATVQSFKGLEAEAVILVDLHGVGSEAFASAAYVGTTRAQAYLAVITPQSESDALDELAQRFGQAAVASES